MSKSEYSGNRRRNQASVPFGRRKSAWLEAIAACPDLPRSALHVARALTDNFNSKTLQAWPSFATIAAKCRLSERHVTRIVPLL